MTTNPHLLRQLVDAHQRDLMDAAGQARLRRAATAERRTRRLSMWRHRRPQTTRSAVATEPRPDGVNGIRPSRQPSAQAAS